MLASVVAVSDTQQQLVRTVDEAADALGVRPATVYRLVSEGDLPAYRISGRRIRIDDAALRSYLAGHLVGSGGITDRDIPAGHTRPEWQ